MEKIKKVLSIILRVGISIAILVLLFRQVDRKSLFEIIKNANKPLLFFALFIFFFNYAFCFFRWYRLLKAVGIKLPLKRVVISFSGGIFFSLFLPSTIGGDLMRSIDLAAHTKKTKEVVATVLLDRLSGYVGLVVVVLISLLLGYRLIDDKSVLLAIGIITAILAGVLLVLFNNFFYTKINKLLSSPNAGKIRDLITGLHQEIHIFRNKKRAMVINLIISLLVQVTGPLTFYFIALAIGIKINLLYFFVLIPVIGAITLLPISIGGLGLRDASTIYFFAKAGVTKDLAFAMSLLNFSFILFYGALGGLIYVLTIHHRRLQSDQSSSLQEARR